MQLDATHLLFSATDVSAHMACAHKTWLEWERVNGRLRRPYFDDPGGDVLKQRGLEHEARVLAGYEAEGRSIAKLDRPPRGAAGAQKGAAEALQAMREGVQVIYQATLFDDPWLGHPDFLVRVDDKPSAFGAWSYEVVDAKLSREAKVGAVLQICFYSELLERAQGAAPVHMHLALGGPGGPRDTTEPFRVVDYAAYYRWAKRHFAEAMAGDAGATTYPEPVVHCDVCDWKPLCRERWDQDDHLSLVAGITRKQRHELEERGVATLAALGRLALPVVPPLRAVSDAALTKVREQARIQLEGREADAHLYELFPDVQEQFGLGALPAPSAGDLFLDFEGDQFALEGGLEYLLGYADTEGQFTGLWAHDRAGEKAAFETFIDLVVARLHEHPDLHVYHFAPYETTAIKRLAATHATRVAEVDQFLKAGTFVDLLRVVRQSLRASVESYSIKQLEPLYRFERRVDLRVASWARAHFEAWLQAGLGEPDEALRGTILGYNRDDVLSTRALRDWLEERRVELAETIGREVPRPSAPETTETDEYRESQERVDRLVAALTEGLPDDEMQHDDEQHARWVLAQLLEWHRREGKSFWWEYFHLIGLTSEELIEERAALGGLVYVGEVDAVARSLIHRYRFPPQEHGLQVGNSPHDPATRKGVGEVWAIDDHAGTIDIKREKKSTAPHPAALVPHDYVPDKLLRESLLQLAEAVVAGGLDLPEHAARLGLLVRRPPRAGQAIGAPLRGEAASSLDAAIRLGRGLDRSVLPIQGPPGSGKTFTGARMILDLLAAGKRVGITATSHKVIVNLLEAVAEAAREQRTAIQGVQVISDEVDACTIPGIEAAKWDRALARLADGTARLVSGTAWVWARPAFRNAVDVLFVDEAGQMSLANVLVCGNGAKSLVLLGDPQQLEQPQKGVHPPGTGLSALEYLARGQDTFPPDRGLFLDQTWRLHPDLCAFTSELYYDGLLTPRPGLERQRVDGPGLLRGAGLRFVPVVHEGNGNESPEEVAEVRRLIASLIDAGATWTDADGVTAPITLQEILVVAPYNAQVGALKEALPDRARVGTVDKFQGQEAPIVILSPASSSPEDAPRGMEFLLSPNRINVATSRPKCLAVIVGSPRLLGAVCSSVRQMQLANGMCRFGELAR